jgi:hypothetical protein
MKRVPGKNEFLKAGRTVSSYPDAVTLEIKPLFFDSNQTVSSCFVAVPQEFLDLRFEVEWSGKVSRDLGEVTSELLREPWTELRPAEALYTLQIPAEGIPLDDSLEVRIFKKDGTQIGCIAGHL